MSRKFFTLLALGMFSVAAAGFAIPAKAGHGHDSCCTPCCEPCCQPCCDPCCGDDDDDDDD
ncbi:MAG: hypothetical protein DWQ34_12390 [Planctomycetota bacterium]|nr:MAG: hypothetical protein DWQ34_12390 [Planctomycetota bacterium]REK28307.1 MAG: hypothetical protein DWQ45_24920 [Planctomycetota bacterium]